MDRELLDKLGSGTYQQYLNELEQAGENHARWLARVNRALVCGCEANPDDLGEAPHTLCQFGRWYDRVGEEELLRMEEFQSIGPVHRDMHLAARELLLQAADKAPIPTDDYDRLSRLTEQLRARLIKLSDRLKGDLGLASRLMGKVFENATEGVIITAPDATILNVNHAFTQVTGYRADEALGQTPHLLYSGRQDDAFYQAMWKTLIDEGQWQGSIWNRRKDGSIYLEHLSIVAVRDEHGETSNYIGIFSDITAEKENEERLYKLAHYDLLTGLPNRVLFEDRLRQAMRQSRRDKRRLAVMFIDLDGFKAINDELGHASGDELLKQVAQRLRESLREADTVGRFGGDEFTVVIGYIEEPDAYGAALLVAEKLIDEISHPYHLDGLERRVSASIGIALYPEHGNSAETLIDNADAAMYQAKRRGKSRGAVYGD